MATRAQNLRHRYGIDVQDYERMYKSQGERCAICKIREKNHLNVDHCHATGKIRGLLCSNCNTAIGKFYDDTSLLSNAILYLNEKHQSWWTDAVISGIKDNVLSYSVTLL